MKRCPLCKKRYPDQKIRRRYGLLQRICPRCYIKYRCMELEIFCTDTIKSCIPVHGASRYRITGFRRNSTGGKDYSRPIVKPVETDNRLEIGGSPETDRTDPHEDNINRNNPILESNLSDGLIDAAPLLSETRSPPSQRTDAVGSEYETTPISTGLSTPKENEGETDDNLREMMQRLNEAEERLHAIELKVYETETRLCQSENKVASLEAERARQDKQLSDSKASVGGVSVLHRMWLQGCQTVSGIVKRFNQELEGPL